MTKRQLEKTVNAQMDIIFVLLDNVDGPLVRHYINKRLEQIYNLTHVALRIHRKPK